jgi:hypothetical protein
VKVPALDGCPKATSSNFEMGQTTTHPYMGLLQVQPEKTLGKKTALHLAHCQDPVHDVARVDTGGQLPLFVSAR